MLTINSLLECTMKLPFTLIALLCLCPKSKCSVYKVNCKAGWTSFQKNCYWLRNREVSRAENEDMCEMMNSKMVSIHSKAENDFLVQLLKAPCTDFWTGGRRKTLHSNAIVWSDNSNHDFTGTWHEDRKSTQSASYVLVYGKQYPGKWLFVTDDKNKVVSCAICKTAPYRNDTYLLLNEIKSINSKVEEISRHFDEHKNLSSALINKKFENLMKQTLNNISNNSKSIQEVASSLREISNDLVRIKKIHIPDSIANNTEEINKFRAYFNKAYSNSENQRALLAASVLSINTSLAKFSEVTLNKISNNSHGIQKISDTLSKIRNEISDNKESFKPILMSVAKVNNEVNEIGTYAKKLAETLRNESNEVGLNLAKVNTKLDLVKEQMISNISSYSNGIQKFTNSITNVSKDISFVQGSMNRKFDKLEEKTLRFISNNSKRIQGVASSLEKVKHDIIQINKAHVDNKLDNFWRAFSNHSSYNSYVLGNVSESGLLMTRDMTQVKESITHLNNDIIMLKWSNKAKNVKFCDGNWTIFEGYCYSLRTDEVEYNESIEGCEANNATLVSIHSKEENDFLVSMLDSHRGYWIGGRRSNHNSTLFEWEDKSHWNFTNWEKTEPKNTLKNNCTMWFSGHWIVDRCLNKHRQLCKKRSISIYENNSTCVESLNNDDPDVNTLHIYVYVLGLIITVMIALNITMCISLRLMYNKITQVLLMRSVINFGSDTL